MDLENVHKYISLRKKVSGVVEALYSGQVFAFVTESSDGGATAYVNPVFMKLVCGAETIFDIPAPCSADSVEEAIADCIQNLHSLNCFKEYDTEFDDNEPSAAVKVNESVEEEQIDEALPISHSAVSKVMADTQSRDHAVEKVIKTFKVDRKTAEKHVDHVIDSAMKEETIDEISKTTLGSYVKKASRDVYLKGMLSKDFENRAKTKKSQEKKDYYNDAAQNFKKKAWSREDNIGKAVDRLTKESFESILEAYHAAAKKGLKEKLVGNQHKLDINKDGKIDATDLHKVRQGHVKENLPPSEIVAADRAAGSVADPNNVGKKAVSHPVKKIVKE